MKIYVVGGAVRDKLLNRQCKDIDYVVVGVSESEFTDKFPEAKKVGKSFPVFLMNGCEYALARTEKKSGVGHKGFIIDSSKDVTLHQDLTRRDFTINSMAICQESGLMHSVKNSVDDLNNKILRHTSSAFKDDPLRVYRAARFASTLGFSVHHKTMKFMKGMSHELDSLTPFRIYTELDRALAGDDPTQFFKVLRECNGLEHWFPEVNNLISIQAGPVSSKHGMEDTFDHTMRVIDNTTKIPALRFASLCHDFGKALSEAPPIHHKHIQLGLPLIEELCERLNVSNDYINAATIFCREHMRMHKILTMNPGKAVKLLIHVKHKMPGGLLGFLSCSKGDGMTQEEEDEIIRRSIKVYAVKLPSKYYGLGANCNEIMLQLRAEAWNKSK